MPVMVSLLRGVNVGGHNKIKMEALRALYESIGLRDAETYVQSGNVVFRTREPDPGAVARHIEDAIEQSLGFRPGVMVRTTLELGDVIARNPFAARRGLDPSRLVVTFLASEPDAAACAKVLGIKAFPEELRILGREIYTYFPNGIANARLSGASVEKTLKTPGTGRNWNTVTRLFEIAKNLED